MPYVERHQAGSLTIHEATPAAVESLTSEMGADGLWVALTNGRSGAARWAVEARTGRFLGDPVAPHGRRPWAAIAASTRDGDDVLAVVGSTSVWRYDPHSGEPRTHPHRPWRVGLNTLAAARLSDGRGILVASTDDGIERLDVDSGAAMAQHPDEKTATIWDVAAATLPDGRVIIAGAGHDWLVYRWDAETGEAVGEPLDGHGISVKAIATTTMPGTEETVIVSGCERGEVRLWDAATGRPIGEPLDVCSDMIGSLAVLAYERGGRDCRMLLCGLSDGTVHRVDLLTGAALGSPISADDWPRTLAALCTPQGVPIAFICHGGKEERITCWRLDTPAPVRVLDLPTHSIGLVRLGDRMATVTGTESGSVTISLLDPLSALVPAPAPGRAL